MTIQQRPATDVPVRIELIEYCVRVNNIFLLFFNNVTIVVISFACCTCFMLILNIYTAQFMRNHQYISNSNAGLQHKTHCCFFDRYFTGITTVKLVTSLHSLTIYSIVTLYSFPIQPEFPKLFRLSQKNYLHPYITFTLKFSMWYSLIGNILTSF